VTTGTAATESSVSDDLRSKGRWWIVSISGSVLVGLYVVSRYNYLLFHTLAELFSVVIGCGIFVIAWNARRVIQNNYLLLLGTAFLSIGLLDLAHTMAYKGMGVFPVDDANPATQLWIAARFTQAVSLLLAALAMGRRLKPETVFLVYTLWTVAVLISIFGWEIFPDCFVESTGLTPFKVNAEYIICLILVAGAVALYRKRRAFDPQVRRLLLQSIALTIVSELAFTSYVNVHGEINAIGHLLKIVAFYLVYKAIIETGITRPHALLLHQVYQSEERYRVLFDMSPDAVFTLDTIGRFIEVNPACESLSGYSQAELRKRVFTDLCAPEELERTAIAFRNNLARGDYGELETAILSKDGSRKELWVAGKPLRSEGRIVALHCTARDISERKQFQEELERLVRERTAKLQELVGELEHFSYTITHDMRAPLRAMRGFGGILKETFASNMPPEAMPYLDSIMNSAERMDRLITDALHYSKAVMKEMTLKRVDARALLQGIVDSYPDLQPPRAHVRIEGDIPDLLANEAGLTQCFSNLLDNAVKFVEPGKMAEVRVWAERRNTPEPGAGPAAVEGVTLPVDGYSTMETRTPLLQQEVVRIWIEDNGIGIPQHAHGRLFQMFQRLSKHYEGTGIGLALVRKVAERMAGRVGFESEPGKGSRFWLEFKEAGSGQ
jgi:PAS domain S-box-containing protein